MSENLQLILIFCLVFLSSVFCLVIGWKAGIAIRELTSYLARVGEMLAWYEASVKKKLPPPTPNQSANPATFETGKVAPDAKPKKNELPFWEDLEQLEEEQARIERGEAGGEGVFDSLDYARRIAEAITDLKELSNTPIKK